MGTKSRLKGNSPILFLVVCCMLIMPVNLFGFETPGSTIPPEQWEKVPPMKKALTPAQQYDLKPSPDKVLRLPPIDVDKLIEEDRAKGDKGRPLRAGIHREINISSLTHGEWYDFDGKGSIWLFEIHAPSASGIDVHFTDVYLPDGARIYVYSPSKPDKYEGPYKWGPELWAGTVWDDKIIIELAIPIPYDRSKAPFKIDKISHLYRPIGRKSLSESGIVPLAATCHNDATCYPDWATEGDAVGRLKFQVSELTGYCTGTIVDNFTQDHTPYFLTANHCLPDDSITSSDIKVYWFYETPTCNGTPPDINGMPISSDAIYLDGKTDMEFSDFTLLEILGTVPRNLTWAGTTTVEPNMGANVVGIHHPGDPPDDYRRISFGDITSTCNNINYWDVDWYSGTTEGGSSGSALWNSSNQVIGQLYGQICTSAEPCDPTKISNYGKFSVSYPFMQSYLQGGSDDSLEENDSRATSKTVSAGDYKGNVVKLNDEDWYKISVPQNTRISADISFINNNGDINMELYKGLETTPVSSSTDTGDSEHVEYYNTTEFTDYFIHVFLADDTRNTYNMTVNLGPDSGTRWIKNYGFFGGTANAIQMTSDSGYIAAGEFNGDLWVFKLDSGGAIQWEKIFDNGGPVESAADIKQTTDGGYIVAGETDASNPGSGYSDIWILKLDSSGSIQWQKTYGFLNADEAKSIQQTTDGGYIVAGFNASYGLWLIKLDANGNIQSQKRYGGGIDDFETIIKTSDGGYIVAAYATGAGHLDFWLLKLDSSLNIQWQKTYGSSIEQDVPHSIQQTTDGGYIVAGETYSFGGGSADFWVLKLDANGVVQWQKSYGSSNGDLAYSIKQTLDGGYIVAGETYSFSTYDFDALILKLDSNGNIEWQRAYGGSDDDGIYSIHQESNGGYIAAGYTYSFSTGNAWVLKLDSNGNIDSCSSVKTSNATAFNTSATIINTNATVVNTSISPTASNASLVSPNTITNAICYSAATQKPEIFVYPSSLNFGYVNPTKYTIRKVRVRNTGKADLTINSVSITGAEFVIETNNCSTIPINSSCTIDVKFAPTTDGAKSAILSISSNETGTPSLVIPLNGIGGIILVVTKVGSGNGTVTSAPTGIECGNDCIEAYGTGTGVILTAAPDSNSFFDGWAGACSGTGNCTITMNYDRTVRAAFAPCTYSISPTSQTFSSGSGSNSVNVTSQAGCNWTATSNDNWITINSGSTGSGNGIVNYSVSENTGTSQRTGTITIAGQTFTVTQGQPQVTLSVIVTGSGNGTVTSSPTGINCGADCTELHDKGTAVILTAQPSIYTAFTGWSGACTGIGACQLTMDANKDVTATFMLNITSAPTSLSFSDVTVNTTSSAQEVTLSNTGLADFHVLSATLTGTDVGMFTVTGGAVNPCPNPPFTAIPASSCNLSVTFTPTSAGSKTATFTVYSDDPDTPALDIPLSGNGIAVSQYALTVEKTGTGSGTVTSEPSGINCGADCSEIHTSGTIVTLSPAPDTGSTFTGWTGCDSVLGNTCDITMNADKTVTASFIPSALYVVWQDDTYGNYEIYLKKSTDGGTNWTTTRLTNNAGNSQNPVMAVDASTVYIVWQDDTYGNNEIYLKKSTDGGANWTTTRLTDNAGSSVAATIAASGNDIYVVWQDDTYGNYETFLKKSTDGGANWTTTRLTNNAGNSQYPSIVVNNAIAYIVWQDDTYGNNEIFIKQSTDGGANWTTTRLTSNAGNSQFSVISGDAIDNSLYVVWQDDTYGNNEIFLKKSTDGGTNWTTTRLTDNAGNSQFPSIVVGGTVAYIVWQDDTYGNNEIYLKKSTDGGTNWTTVRLTNNAGNSQLPIVMGSGSEVYIVWQDDTYGNNEIFIKKSTDGGTNWTTTRLTTNAGNSSMPAITK